MKPDEKYQESSNRPLCVDLDGTLIGSDMLFETLILLLKKNLMYIFLIPFWILKGRPYLKQQIALRTEFNPAQLIYNQELLIILKDLYQKKRSLVLATGSDILIAKKIASYLGLFSGVIASDGKHNLSGKGKMKVLTELFKDQGFDYAGNSSKDLIVWKYAHTSWVVNATHKTTQQAKKISQNLIEITPKKTTINSWLKALRIHQWIKNILIFLPILTAHAWTQIHTWTIASLAFLSFSFASSSIYIFNDLMDLESDRNHPQKRNRPFANNQLSISSGLITIPILMLISLWIGIQINISFLFLLLTYLFITTGYTVYIKSIIFVDTLILAILYTIRILAGSLATHIMTSQWLLAFSLFLFLSLALIKRHSEILIRKKHDLPDDNLRGYIEADTGIISQFGITSGYISVLIFSLYIHSDTTHQLYRSPNFLWIISILILYWISRIWILSFRGKMSDDPVIFALKDVLSYIVVLMILITIIVAKTF